MSKLFAGSRRYRALSVLIAVLVGVLGGGGVATALREVNGTGDGPSTGQLAAHVNAAEAAVERVGRGLEDVDRLSDLASVAVGAGRAAADVSARRVQVATSRDDAARRAAEGVLAPAEELLRAIAGADAVRADALDGWPAVSADVERHADALITAQTAVLPGAHASAGAGKRAADGAEHVDDVVTSARRALKRWRREVRAFRKDLAGKRTTAKHYESTVTGLLGRYAGTRSDLQAWINHVEAYNASFEEGYSELSAQKDARQAIRSQIAAQTPPAPVAAAHNRLVAVIDQAIDALDSAVAGLDQLQRSRWTFGPYDSYDETPSWQEFRAASNRVSSEFPAAQAAWTREVRDYVKDVTRGTPPKRPAV